MSEAEGMSNGEKVHRLQVELRRTRLQLKIAIWAGFAMGAWAIFSIYLINKMIERAL